MTRCARPGCGGEVIDGYCDVAGHRAPDPGPATQSDPVSADPSGVPLDPALALST